VHEAVAGVIPDTATPEMQRSVTQRLDRNIRETDVDGVPVHVLAVGGDVVTGRLDSGERYPEITWYGARVPVLRANS
jgi:hypothetical protein